MAIQDEQHQRIVDAQWRAYGARNNLDTIPFDLFDPDSIAQYRAGVVDLLDALTELHAAWSVDPLEGFRKRPT